MARILCFQVGISWERIKALVIGISVVKTCKICKQLNSHLFDYQATHRVAQHDDRALIFVSEKNGNGRGQNDRRNQQQQGNQQQQEKTRTREKIRTAGENKNNGRK